MTGQAQDNNGEEELDGANAKGDDFEHAWRGNCTKRKWESVSELREAIACCDVLWSLMNW